MLVQGYPKLVTKETRKKSLKIQQQKIAEAFLLQVEHALGNWQGKSVVITVPREFNSYTTGLCKQHIEFYGWSVSIIESRDGSPTQMKIY